MVRRPALLVGNSIGAIAVLNAAFERPALVAGLALLNAAGRFDSGGGARLPPPPPLVPSTPLELISDAGARIAAHAVFLFTKYRVRQVLSSVYVNKGRVDEALVASIYDAACDPSAAEAFFRISGAGGRSVRTLDALLDAAKAAGPLPLALVWGLRDPWMQPAKAAQIVAYYPTAEYIPVPGAGHWRVAAAAGREREEARVVVTLLY